MCAFCKVVEKVLMMGYIEIAITVMGNGFKNGKWLMKGVKKIMFRYIEVRVSVEREGERGGYRVRK